MFFADDLVFSKLPNSEARRAVDHGGASEHRMIFTLPTGRETDGMFGVSAAYGCRNAL